MENNPAPITDAINVVAAEGQANVSEETIALHKLVNKELGTTYADDETALQAIKQTKAYVGKVGQVLPYLDKAKEKGIHTSKLIEAMENVLNGNGQQPSPAPSVDTDKFATREQVAKLQADIFYRDNPSVAPYRQAIDEFAAATGKSQPEIIQMDAFKTLVGNATGFDEMQKAKSVLQTNPRLGVATDNLTKAQEAVKSGDFAKAQDLAVGAVMEQINAQEKR